MTFREIPRFNSSDSLLSIDNGYFEKMVDSLYPPELQFNKANFSDTGVPYSIHLIVFNKTKK